MNIKEFNVTNKPFATTLVFELYEGSDFDKKAYRVLKKEKQLLADGKFDDEVFCYDITDKMSLRKYMSMGLNRQKVAHLMERVLEAEACFNLNQIDPHYLMLDSDLVLVDKNSEEITFIYVPATDHGLVAKPMRAFIKEVLANAVYDESEDLDYVGRLITYVNKNKHIDPGSFNNLIQKIKEGPAKIKDVSGEMPVPPEQNVRPVSLQEQAMRVAKSVAAEAAVAGLDVPEDMSVPADTEAGKVAEPEFDIPDAAAAQVPESDIHLEIPEPMMNDRIEAEPMADIVLEPETLNGEQECPMADIPEPKEAAPVPEVKEVGAAPEPKKNYPYLVRAKNQEIITVDKDEFKIGKIPGMADYLLSDNPAVSRMHAIIHNVDNTYYICDNYSTNATYLNGQKLEPGKNYLLMNGVKIKLANEEFTYFCED